MHVNRHEIVWTINPIIPFELKLTWMNGADKVDKGKSNARDTLQFFDVVFESHIRLSFLPNVKEHAPPLAGASVETGGDK